MHKASPLFVLLALLVSPCGGVRDASNDIDPATAALIQLAKRVQCPNTDVPMPCPNQTQPGPAFGMHIPKTGGRSMYGLVEQLSGQDLCKWAPLR